MWICCRIHGINNRATAGLVACKKTAASPPRETAEAKAVVAGSSAFPRTPRRTSFLDAVNTGEFDYVNLHWYFVNDLNWPAVLAARAHDMGVFIISPNDKGGKLQEPGPKSRALRAAHADAFSTISIASRGRKFTP
jgi:predicted aldo/keto reductase-like oxidoreductase